MVALLVNQPTDAVENGWHPVLAGTVGGSDTWGHRQGIVFVHSFWFDSHQDNTAFKTREGIVFVVAPSPKYPAGASHLTGQAVIRLKLDRKSGNVLSVALIQSTGQALLDRAALDALKRWQAKPGVKPASVDVPVVFTGPRSHWRYGG